MVWAAFFVVLSWKKTRLGTKFGTAQRLDKKTHPNGAAMLKPVTLKPVMFKNAMLKIAMLKFIRSFFAVLGIVALAPVAALAAQPEPWQTNFQPGVTPVWDAMNSFHNMLLIIIFAISIFVLALLVYVIVRYREGRNPVPSKISHNSMIEVVWTLVPCLILVVIGVPSLKLLYFADKAPDAEMTVKAIGKQWYWSYEYPDHNNFTFDAIMVQDADLQPGQPRLLATDNHVVVPVDTKVRLLVASGDVMHGWYVPALGVQKEAMPGRVNETWFKATREGVYYGMCTELCGTNHAFMPIAVEVVSKERFAQWVEEAKAKFGASASLGQPAKLAAAQP